MADTIFKIVNAKQFQASIRKKAKLLKRQGGTGGPYHMAVIYLDRWIQKNFDHDGRDAMPETGGWKKLSDVTLLARKKGWGDYVKDSAPSILRNRGTLKKSWKHDYNNRRAIIENYATAKGSTYYYGVAHDEGKGRLPERRILPKEKQVSKKIKEIFGHWIRTSMK
jgi:phage gpG-like protein